MRQLLAIFLVVGVPAYWFETLASGTFDPLVGFGGTLFALGMIAGEVARANARQRRRDAERAQAEWWRRQQP